MPSPSKTPRGKTWLVIGNMRYGTKRTDEFLNKRAAFILAHPEVYSIYVMSKRLTYEYYDHKLAIHTSDLVMALDISMRKAQLLLQVARKKLRKKKNDYVTVSEFCKLNNLNEKELRIKIVPKPVGHVQ